MDKENITIKDLISILNDLPEEAKELPINHICGCSTGLTSNELVPGFQFELNTDDRQHKKYVIVPRFKNDIVHDSFGKRCCVK